MRTKVIFTITLAVTLGLALIAGQRDWFMSSPNAFIYFLTGILIVFFASAIGYARREDIRRVMTPDKPAAPGPDERRRFVRIQHKLRHRPHLTIDGADYEVKDISEQGIRFANPDNRPFDKWVRGILVFSSGRDMEIDGLVARKRTGEVALQLITTIPVDIIEEEARYRLAPPD